MLVFHVIDLNTCTFHVVGITLYYKSEVKIFKIIISKK